MLAVDNTRISSLPASLNMAPRRRPTARESRGDGPSGSPPSSRLPSPGEILWRLGEGGDGGSSIGSDGEAAAGGNHTHHHLNHNNNHNNNPHHHRHNMNHHTNKHNNNNNDNLERLARRLVTEMPSLIDGPDAHPDHLDLYSADALLVDEVFLGIRARGRARTRLAYNAFAHAAALRLRDPVLHVRGPPTVCPVTQTVTVRWTVLGVGRLGAGGLLIPCAPEAWVEANSIFSIGNNNNNDDNNNSGSGSSSGGGGSRNTSTVGYSQITAHTITPLTPAPPSLEDALLLALGR